MDRNSNRYWSCVQPYGVIMKYLLVLPLLLLVSCSSLDIVGDAVNKYCELSPTQRQSNREAIANVVAPNTIQIECVENAEEGS